jgi:hypothetical protein
MIFGAWLGSIDIKLSLIDIDIDIDTDLGAVYSVKLAMK